MKRSLIVLILTLCAACATPQRQAYVAAPDSLPVTPVLKPVPVTLSDGATLEDDSFIAADGVRLPLRSWLPEGEPTAVIVALHGFNDYSRAFRLPGNYMRRHGVAVYAYDQRGFGHAPHFGVWAGTDNLTRDASDMVRAIMQRYPHVPVYLLGESMGGAVAVAAASQPDFPPIDGVILSAPALWGGDTMNPFYRALLWSFAHTFPGKKLTGEDLHVLASDNIAMLRALGGDPYFIKATRVDAIYGLVHLMDVAYANIGKVRAPILLLYGSHDQVIPPQPIINSLRHAPDGTKAAYYPLGYHMLLRDLHGDVPVRDILAWIDNPYAPLPSGYDRRAQRMLLK